ncbi:hypothetical protein [Chitinophaga parva]|nr:hypothetical protein [Chitinophaga parva]
MNSTGKVAGWESIPGEWDSKVVQDKQAWQKGFLATGEMQQECWNDGIGINGAGKKEPWRWGASLGLVVP